MSRYVKVDRRYNQPFRLTGYGCLAVLKWAGLVSLWIVANILLASAHLGVLVLATTAGLIWYGVYSVRRNRAPQLPQRTYQPVVLAPNQWQFNAPPDWPAPPLGWSPPPDWKPDPTWPSAPPGWQFWTPAPALRGAVGERNSRSITQDVKIAVSVRDEGMCVQCGSNVDLHYDHKVPWSRGGTNTVNNIQLLCGRCNRIKGADDIPV